MKLKRDANLESCHNKRKLADAENVGIIEITTVLRKKKRNRYIMQIVEVSVMTELEIKQMS